MAQSDLAIRSRNRISQSVRDRFRGPRRVASEPPGRRQPGVRDGSPLLLMFTLFLPVKWRIGDLSVWRAWRPCDAHAIAVLASPNRPAARLAG